VLCPSARHDTKALRGSAHEHDGLLCSNVKLPSIAVLCARTNQHDMPRQHDPDHDNKALVQLVARRGRVRSATGEPTGAVVARQRERDKYRWLGRSLNKPSSPRHNTRESKHRK
jgi:hypothetical protein